MLPGRKCVWQKQIQDNGQRVNILSPGVLADSVKITVTATHGYPAARIFEVRLYE